MSNRLAGILDGYLDLRWQMNPVEATFVGRHEFDGQLPRLDAQSVKEQLGALRGYAMSLEEVEAPSLEDEIDRTAALHAIRHDILQLERERPFAHNPAHAILSVLNGLYLLLARNEQDPPARAVALLSRLTRLPDFLSEAEEALTEPRRVFVETARAILPGGIALVRDGMSDSSADLSSLDPLELDRARGEAVDALVSFGDYLALMLERANGEFAIGRDLFDLKLHTAHMIRENADELLRVGELVRVEALEGLARIANEIRRAADWRDIARELREDVPSRETAIDEYASHMRSARDFTSERGLVDIPAGELSVCPTPAFLRGLTPFAAYQGPGAFDDDQRGIFFVTLPEKGAPWRLHCRAELPTTALHEGVPGHHLQILTANRLERPLRRVLSTPAAQEGWALYCESLMAEEGFIAEPAVRFFQMHHLLWRATRIILDVSLHTRGMTMARAVEMLCEDLGLDAASAEAEARRYCADPTYQLCYAVGRRDILRLRADARAARGNGWTLAGFHRELLDYGALPTALARWGMGLS